MGAIFVRVTEKWDWGDCFYWAVMTCTSIGLGDFSPQQPPGRVFAVFYTLVAVGCFATSLGHLSAMIMEYETERAVAAFVARGVSAELISEMDCDGNGKVDRFEFVTHMLLSTGKLERQDVDSALALFHSLDVDGNGHIGPEDVVRPRPLPPALEQSSTRSLRTSRTSTARVGESAGSMREALVVRSVE